MGPVPETVDSIRDKAVSLNPRICLRTSCLRDTGEVRGSKREIEVVSEKEGGSEGKKGN